MTTTIPPVPALNIDATFRRRGWRPSVAGRIERQTAWALLHTMSQHCGGHPLVVDDGEARLECSTPAAAMEAIFDRDDVIVRCGREWVYLVMGNGTDMITDWGDTPAANAAVGAAKVAAGIED